MRLLPLGPRATVIRRPSRTKVNTFPYCERDEIIEYHLEFLTAHLLTTAVEESQRVHSIFHSGTYDGDPMEGEWGETLVARQKLKGTRSASTKMSWVEHVYKLAEDVKNDDHRRKRGEGSEEFEVADTCDTREGEVLQGEDRSQVSRHSEEDEDKLTRPKRRGLNKTEKPIVPLSRLGRRRLRLRSIETIRSIDVTAQQQYRQTERQVLQTTTNGSR